MIRLIKEKYDFPQGVRFVCFIEIDGKKLNLTLGEYNVVSENLDKIKDYSSLKNYLLY